MLLENGQLILSFKKIPDIYVPVNLLCLMYGYVLTYFFLYTRPISYTFKFCCNAIIQKAFVVCHREYVLPLPSGYK